MPIKATLDNLLHILYITLDDVWKDEHQPNRRPPETSDVELVCLSVAQALLKCPSERCFYRTVHNRLGHLFPKIPARSVYNRRLRGLTPLMHLACKTINALLNAGIGNIRVIDSTTIRLAASRETVERSALSTLATYGKKSSHMGFYWGARLHLLVSAQGDILEYELTDASVAKERDVLLEFLDSGHHRETIIYGDKNYRGRAFHEEVARSGAQLMNPPKGNIGHSTSDYWRGTRQIVELVFQSLKEHLSLEGLQAKTEQGLITRVLQRILAYTAARYCNALANLPSRTLIAYDH